MTKLIFIFLLLSCSSATATSFVTAEGRLADGLTETLWKYRTFVSSEPPETWAQLEKANKGFLRTAGLTDLFAFVPLADRSRFPKGNLVFVQTKPMSWPSDQEAVKPDGANVHLRNANPQGFRYLIYEKNGEYIFEHWDEADFQSMLSATGLTVPSPTPHQQADPRNQADLR